MSGQEHLITRAGLASQAWPRSLIDLATDRQLHRVRHGLYSHSADVGSVIGSLLAKGGPLATLSHRFAAHLHGFDSFEQVPTIELTVPYGSTFHPVGVNADAIGDREFVIHRSRTLNQDDVVIHDGVWPVTNKARTILDLSRKAPADWLEVVVESALRSPDRFHPSSWDEDCLDRLNELAGTHPKLAGPLGLVLRRRPSGCLPTGSPRETMLLQAARSVGLGDLQRQMKLTVVDVAARDSITVWPDLGELDRLGLTLEYDGEDYHRDRRSAERKRDNLVGRVVHIVRFDATTTKDQNAAKILAAARAAARRPWPDPNWLIARGPHEITITIPK